MNIAEAILELKASGESGEFDWPAYDRAIRDNKFADAIAGDPIAYHPKIEISFDGSTFVDFAVSTVMREWIKKRLAEGVITVRGEVSARCSL